MKNFFCLLLSPFCVLSLRLRCFLALCSFLFCFLISFFMYESLFYFIVCFIPMSATGFKNFAGLVDICQSNVFKSVS